MVSIRTARDADLPSVMLLWRDAATEPSATDDLAALTTLLDREADALLVALEEDVLVGTLIATWDGWRASMYRLAVAEPQRRRGIARALVSDGEPRLRQKGARRLHLIVASDQEPAQAFWTASGYRHTDQLRFVKDVG